MAQRSKLLSLIVYHRNTGNAQDFGDLTGGIVVFGSGVHHQTTRGVFGGGYYMPLMLLLNVIDFITIASTGNALILGI